MIHTVHTYIHTYIHTFFSVRWLHMAEGPAQINVGRIPFWDLKVLFRIFSSMRSLIGSQSSSWRKGVLWPDFLAVNMRRDAVIWASCRGRRAQIGLFKMFSFYTEKCQIAWTLLSHEARYYGRISFRLLKDLGNRLLITQPRWTFLDLGWLLLSVQK